MPGETGVTCGDLPSCSSETRHRSLLLDPFVLLPSLLVFSLPATPVNLSFPLLILRESLPTPGMRDI